MADRPGGREFRPDIEGLRAVAVLAVVLFHAGVPGEAGGFVGVDVFFVLSGFLITGLLWREVGATGRLRAAHFYAARARRLLPAAITVLVATAATATAVLPPLQTRGVLRDAVASALYAANYRLAVDGTDYLAADSPPSPFQHYWSLGVEEQFYLLWPALLVLAALAGRRVVRRSRTPLAAPVGALALVAAASFAVSLQWTRSSPPWAYFSLPTRAWELAVGGLVALAVPAWRGLPAAVLRAVGWVGLTAVVGSSVLLDSSTPFPGTAALAPVLGTAAVLASGCASARGGAAALLALPPLRWIGRISYSWYLWHWPVLVLAPAVLGHPLGLPARLAAAAVSGGLAAGTLLLIENPVRFAAPLRRSPRRSLLAGGALTAAGVCAALLALVLAPATVGRGAAVAAPRVHLPAAPARSAPAAPTVDPAVQRVRAGVAQVQAALAAAAGQQAVPSNLTPPLGQAYDDTATPFQVGCDRTFTASDVPPCLFGDPAGTTTVALVGDSHAAAWFPAVEPLAQQRHWRLAVLAKATCPFLLDLPEESPFLGRHFTECEQWRTAALARLTADRPALVVLAMARRYDAQYGFASYDAAWLAALTRTVARLRALGSTVLVMGPVADPHVWAPTCLSDHLDSAAACAPSRAAAVNAPGIAAEDAATRAGGGDYWDVSDLFCTPDRCPLVVGNDLVYRDDNHVTVEYASVLAPVVAAEITAVLPGG